MAAFANTAACTRAQACSILLVSGCARRMPNHLMTQLKLCTFYSSSLLQRLHGALHASTTRSMPTQLCMRHNQMRRSAQSALSRSAAFHSFLSNPELLGKRMTHGSLCQYSCVHASTSLPKFACACLRLLHARSSQSSARVVRTLLVNLPCNVCTAPLHANTTRSMPTRICMRHHQTRRSAQSALSRSAAFYSF